MLKSNSQGNRLAAAAETTTFNKVMDGLTADKQGTDFKGYFWPVKCFSCPKKKDDAVHAFISRLTGRELDEEADLGTCKVCVKYALHLAEVRKVLKHMERFFQRNQLPK